VPFQYTTAQVELDKLVSGRPGEVKDELPFPKNTQKKEQNLQYIFFKELSSN